MHLKVQFLVNNFHRSYKQNEPHKWCDSFTWAASRNAAISSRLTRTSFTQGATYVEIDGFLWQLETLDNRGMNVAWFIDVL